MSSISEIAKTATATVNVLAERQWTDTEDERWDSRLHAHLGVIWSRHRWWNFLSAFNSAADDVVAASNSSNGEQKIWRQ